jgi:hypothetical protein
MAEAAGRSPANVIQFPGDAPYGGVNQERAKDLAADDRLSPLALRVFFAAVGWSNRIGHACFERRGLAEVLCYVDKTTGEIVRPRPQGVNKAISKAKSMGLIEPQSDARCLVLSDQLWRKRGKGNASCSYHGVGVAGDHWIGGVGRRDGR